MWTASRRSHRRIRKTTTRWAAGWRAMGMSPPRSASPHIALPPGLAGIRGPMAFRPETAAPINELVDVLLRGPSTLTPGERELIAMYVSSQNDCRYCQTIHGAVAARHLGSESVVAEVACGLEDAEISDKLKA